MRIAILGFGREGQSVLKFLQNRRPTQTKRGLTQKADEIWILDKNPNLKIPSSHSHFKISHRLGEKYLSNLKRFDLIFRSPGIPYTLPQLYRARCEGTEVSSATKLFFQHVPKNLKIIGVTGTKGKGTTCTLIYKILKAAGKNVLLAGNIGKPMLEILPRLSAIGQRKSAFSPRGSATFVVLELSSFQLQDLPYSPAIAVVVDIFPDHLDQHKSLREYYGSKANIGRFQKKSDFIFYFADNKLSKQIAFKSPARKIAVSAPATLERNKTMATAVTKHLGIAEKTIEKTLKNFRGIEHRLELVRSIKIAPRINADHTRTNAEKFLRKSALARQNFQRKFRRVNQRRSASISFYNDSASTNPNSTAMAIRTLPGPIILIAGGKAKVPDFSPLAEEIKRSGKVKAAVLFGENRLKIRSGLEKEKCKMEIKLVKDLDSAVKLAFKKAKTLNPIPYTPNPIIVLFSPASASFDQFKNYVERGEKFKKAARALKLRG